MVMKKRTIKHSLTTLRELNVCGIKDCGRKVCKLNLENGKNCGIKVCELADSYYCPIMRGSTCE